MNKRKKKADAKKYPRRITKRMLREWAQGYFSILPWLIGIGIFFVYSMIRSLQFAFNTVILSGGVQLEPLNYTFENFANVFAKETSLPILIGEYLTNMVLRLPIIVSFALIIAMLLNSRIRFRLGFRMIFFLPVIIATGPVMAKLTGQGAGSIPLISQETLATFLSIFPDYIANPVRDLFSSLIMILWNSGIQILVFLSGLQKVPFTLYEAAKIDGANGWETFWKITIPTMKPMILLNAVYTVVTQSASGSIVNLISSTVTEVGKGYSHSAAIAWIYALLISLVLLVVFLLFRERSDKNVKYETKRVVKRG